MELGSLLQLAGDGPSAQFSYESALRFDAGDMARRSGWRSWTAPPASEGLARASQALRRLAVRYPQSQLVSFNRGWLEIYRRQAAPARIAWRRTIALDADSRLGRTAAALLATLESTPGGRNP